MANIFHMPACLGAQVFKFLWRIIFGRFLAKGEQKPKLGGWMQPTRGLQFSLFWIQSTKIRVFKPKLWCNFQFKIKKSLYLDVHWRVFMEPQPKQICWCTDIRKNHFTKSASRHSKYFQSLNSSCFPGVSEDLHKLDGRAGDKWGHYALILP